MSTELETLRTKARVWRGWSQRFVQPNGWTVIPEHEDANCPCSFSNDARSRLEVLEFKADPPLRYFLYIDEAKRKATTFTGDTLGTVTFGREFRDNFGGTRVPVWVTAVNGCTYAGTYFKSAGDYARVKRCK